jgi:hypothetical protein
VRLAGAAQLVLATAVAGHVAGATTGPMWRESRPGCLDQVGWVACEPRGTDGALGRVGLALGTVIGLLVVVVRGRLMAAARVSAVVVVTWGTAMAGAGTWDAARPRPLACFLRHASGHGFCAYPPPHVHDLYLTGVIGLVLGLMVVAGEAASRRALDVPRLGWRRVIAATLMTGAVPLGLYGLILIAQDAGVGEAFGRAGLPCVVAAGVAVAVGQMLRTIGASEPAPSLDQA